MFLVFKLVLWSFVPWGGKSSSRLERMTKIWSISLMYNTIVLCAVVISSLCVCVFSPCRVSGIDSSPEDPQAFQFPASPPVVPVAARSSAPEPPAHPGWRLLRASQGVFSPATYTHTHVLARAHTSQLSLVICTRFVCQLIKHQIIQQLKSTTWMRCLTFQSPFFFFLKVECILCKCD